MIENVGGSAARGPRGPARLSEADREDSVRQTDKKKAEKAPERTLSGQGVDRLVREVEEIPAERPQKVEQAVQRLESGSLMEREVLQNTAQKIVEQNT